MAEQKKLGERMKKVRKELGLIQKDFAAAVGITDAYISDIEKGKKYPSDPILQLIAVKHHINLTWLETGTGPMFVWQSPANKKERLSPKQLEAQSHDNYAYLPACRKQGEPDEVVDSLAFKKQWLTSELQLDPKDLYLLNVEDDSMTPSLNPGDLVLVNHQETEVARDGVYVVRLDGTLRIKRLQRLPGNQVMVSSQNQDYESFTVDLDQQAESFTIIGRVVWAGKKM